MSQYYYLISSLPYIYSGAQVIMHSDEFLENCRFTMSPEDFSRLAACRIDAVAEDLAPDAHPLLVKWQGWMIALRNELALLRGQKLKKDGERFVRQGADGAGAFAVAREAESRDNPVAGEEIIVQSSWAFLEELEAGHVFDLESVMIYYLKLQLLERGESFSRQKGEEVYKRVYDTVAAAIREASGYDSAK